MLSQPLKQYEKLLQRADKLAAKGKSTLYDRVALLSKVHDDKEFITDMQATGQSPIQYLSERLTDACANFLELYHMLKMYPNKEQWVNGQLDLMKREAILALVRKGGKGQEKERVRQTVSLAQYHKLEQENALLKQEVEHLRRELQLAMDTIEALKGGRRKAS